MHAPAVAQARDTAPLSSPGRLASPPCRARGKCGCGIGDALVGGLGRIAHVVGPWVSFGVVLGELRSVLVRVR
jgi:hypothetical protein